MILRKKIICAGLCKISYVLTVFFYVGKIIILKFIKEYFTCKKFLFRIVQWIHNNPLSSKWMMQNLGRRRIILALHQYDSPPIGGQRWCLLLSSYGALQLLEIIIQIFQYICRINSGPRNLVQKLAPGLPSRGVRNHLGFHQEGGVWKVGTIGFIQFCI